jgi:Uma2 family endonuclease
VADGLVSRHRAAASNPTFYRTDDVLLVVEVVSRHSSALDRLLKPSLYAKAGIPYFWLIETEGGISVRTFKLDFSDEVYQPSGVFTDVVKLDEPWQLEVPISRLRPRHL